MDKYDAYLFDWDGTIARSLEAWLELLREYYTKYGYDDLPDSEIVKAFGNMTKVSRDIGMSEEVYAKFHDEVRDEAKKRMPRVATYEGIASVLEHLQNQGKKVGLITTNWRVVIEDILKEHSLDDDFEIIVSGNDTRAHKPDPEGILIALEKFGVAKGKAIMLGDSPHDIGAANNAGIDSVLYYPASHELFYDFDKLQELKPTYTIGDWAQLFDALQK